MVNDGPVGWEWEGIGRAFEVSLAVHLGRWPGLNSRCEGHRAGLEFSEIGFAPTGQRKFLVGVRTRGFTPGFLILPFQGEDACRFLRCRCVGL